MTTTEEFVTPAGGPRIFARSWLPEGEPRAVVAICHGFNSHSGQYEWPATELARQGFAVYAMDMRGRGKSDGPRFFVEQVSEYVEDLSTLIQLAKSRQPGLAVYLLGHSAGGVTSCTYALERQHELAGLICESFAFKVPAPDLALAAIKGISEIAPHLPVFKLNNVDFTRDPEALARLNADPLIHNEIQPADTVAAMARANERLKREFPTITLPLLILHGSVDRATCPSGSRFFHETAGSTDKSLKIYEGHFHDLLADTGKEEVLADIVAWIEQRLPAAGAS